MFFKKVNVSAFHENFSYRTITETVAPSVRDTYLLCADSKRKSSSEMNLGDKMNHTVTVISDIWVSVTNYLSFLYFQAEYLLAKNDTRKIETFSKNFVKIANNNYIF